MQLVDGYYITDGDLAKHHNARSVIEHDQNLHKKVLEFSTARNHMVDVGGNVGRWSIEFAKHFKIVSAFEPAPYHIDCFKQNCHQNTKINLHLKQKKDWKNQLMMCVEILHAKFLVIFITTNYMTFLLTGKIDCVI